MCQPKQPDSVQDRLVTRRGVQTKEKFDLHALMSMGGFDEASEVTKRILGQQSCLDKDDKITTPLEGKFAEFLLQPFLP